MIAGECQHFYIALYVVAVVAVVALLCVVLGDPVAVSEYYVVANILLLRHHTWPRWINLVIN